MRKIFLSVMVVVTTFTACDQKESKEDVSEDQELVKAETEEVFLGESFKVDQGITLTSLVEDMNSSDSVMAVVETKVTEVCQAKGCWMKVELPNGESMRVTFKDYGFFVPKNLAGQSVKMMGVAKIEETDIETLKHFAEDAGKSTEEIAEITEPKMDYKFVAYGVKITE